MLLAADIIIILKQLRAFPITAPHKKQLSSGFLTIFTLVFFDEAKVGCRSSFHRRRTLNAPLITTVIINAGVD